MDAREGPCLDDEQVSI